MDFNTILNNWYAKNKRSLPWRETHLPYHIWISEIILQQTQVVQGLDYYLRFITRFPSIKSLAEASEDNVLKQWQGLGYYSRARNLHKTAQIITTQYNGIFPSTYDEIVTLKGIGPYTAAAIASIAFVITSYSIHYTKLYDRARGLGRPTKRDRRDLDKLEDNNWNL